MKAKLLNNLLLICCISLPASYPWVSARSAIVLKIKVNGNDVSGAHIRIKREALLS